MDIFETNGKMLIQAIEVDSGQPLGLYLVPIDKVDEFENEINSINDQDAFDDNNSAGAERIFAGEALVGDLGC